MMENKNLRPFSTPSDTNYLVGKLPSHGGKKKDGGKLDVSHVPGKMASHAGKKKDGGKPRGFDRRCRSKFEGGNAGDGTFRKNGHQVTDCNDSDIESILPEKRKKENLAHMLNMKFQLAPRESITSAYRHSGHSNSSHFSRHSYTKDHYLQANCQFVVKADGDYTAYLSDPDLLVPWETIEQIRIWGSEVASCPICLDSPVAARMTRCGHIYCWSCVLHFLALSDKASRPCPICDAPIRDGDLKSVVALEQRQFQVGHTIEFRLMKRDRHSLLPRPVHHNPTVCSSAVSLEQSKPMYLTKAGANHVFSKLLLCTPKDVNEILRSEEKELLLQYENEKDCPESCFIQLALERISLSREKNPTPTVDFNAALHDDLEPSENNLEDEQQSASSLMDEKALVADETSRCPSTSIGAMCDQLGPDHGTELHCLPCDDGNRMASPQIRNQVGQQKNVFYFYQSSDGQAIFMHSLNVQMLVSQYGSLEFCPEIIEGEIAEGEYLSMNEDTRNRLRYLGHIPISKQFQIVEIYLNEAYVDPSISQEFQDRIDDRERRRRRKLRDEERRDLQIQRAEDGKWGRSKNKAIVHLNSPTDFPAFSPPAEWQDPSAFSMPGPDGLTLAEGSVLETHGTGANDPGPSFAQMLRGGKTKATVGWPVASRSSAPPSNRPLSRFRSDSENEPDYEGYSPVPEYRDTFSSALAAAFDQAAKLTDDVPVKSEEKLTKKGKKKVKQKVLFATGMNFM